ncbi:MAG: hypothetical protein H6597_06545 [Flavobacteriales bacterium]|nr:hypothetical protein [Flavobacteriales bacterium]MCB9194175.1 hypothetical protein [Flavobacteriales bacterium]
MKYLLILGCVGVSGPVQAQLQDPGFEQGNTYWQFTCPDDGWFVGSSAPGGGSLCAEVTMISATRPDCYHVNSTGTFPFVYQELPGVQNGDHISVTFWHRGIPEPPTLQGSLSLQVVFGWWAPPLVGFGNDACSWTWHATDDIWQPITVACTLTGMPTGATAAVFLGGQITNFGNGVIQVDNASLTVTSPTVSLAAKAWLDGAFDIGTNTMHDDLRSAGLLPLTEPYSNLLGLPGGETTTAPVLATTGPNAIVDWVRLELRTGSNAEGATTVSTRHALIQRDGDIVDVDGISPVTFDAVPGNYYVALRHRNHLGVMTDVPMALSTAPTVVDLRAPTTLCHVRPAPANDIPRRSVGGTHTLWAGNTVPDVSIKYTGSANDRDAILQAIGGSVPTATISGQYLPEDINMDGVVKYAGANNDRDVVLQTIGGVVPTATRVQQLP